MRNKKFDRFPETHLWWAPRCPECGNQSVWINHILSARLPWWYYVECARCHYCGKTRLGKNRAMRAWTKKSHRSRKNST